MVVRLTALLVFLLPAMALPAAADPEQEAIAFVREGVSRGIAILEETGPDDPARFARFRSFVHEIIDTRALALFVLGPYRLGAERAELDAFVGSFTAYAVATYETRLNGYGGQTIEVTDAIARNDRDMLVTARIVDRTGAPLADMAFRILKGPEGFRLFDVQVAGIWLAVEQRNQYASFLAQNGGRITALIDYLDAQTAALRPDEAAGSQS